MGGRQPDKLDNILANLGGYDLRGARDALRNLRWAVRVLFAGDLDAHMEDLADEVIDQPESEEIKLAGTLLRNVQGILERRDKPGLYANEYAGVSPVSDVLLRLRPTEINSAGVSINFTEVLITALYLDQSFAGQQLVEGEQPYQPFLAQQVEQELPQLAEIGVVLDPVMTAMAEIRGEQA